jgi:trehalose 6-phosphate phosphatase
VTGPVPAGAGAGPQAAAVALAALRREPGRAVVALDFDGTLAPIVARPELARPQPGAVEELARLAGRVGRLALVSGRPAADLARLAGLTATAGPAGLAGVLAVGHYGLQVVLGGRLVSPAPVPGVAAARAGLAALAAAAGAGVRVEDKEHSLAVHTRGADDPEATLAALAAPVRALAAPLGLEVLGGRLVWELRPPGVDKGGALRALCGLPGAPPGALDELAPPPQPLSAVLYVGDDVGDLAAFAEIARLRADGVPAAAVAVAGDGSDPRVSAAADLVVDGPAGTVALLAGLLAGPPAG